VSITLDIDGKQLPLHVGQGANISKVAAEFAIKEGLVGQDAPSDDPTTSAHGASAVPRLQLTQDDVEAIAQIRDVILNELESGGLVSARSTATGDQEAEPPVAPGGTGG
jgi:hypothetical protein